MQRNTLACRPRPVQGVLSRHRRRLQLRSTLSSVVPRLERDLLVLERAPQEASVEEAEANLAQVHLVPVAAISQTPNLPMGAAGTVVPRTINGRSAPSTRRAELRPMASTSMELGKSPRKSQRLQCCARTTMVARTPVMNRTPNKPILALSWLGR